MKLCRGYQIHDKTIAVFQSASFQSNANLVKCKGRACKEICTKLNFVDAMNNKRIEEMFFNAF